MGRKSKLIGHRVTAVSLALMLSATGAVPMNVLAAPRDSQAKETFSNPFIYSDVPDIDIIRVGDAYYMVSTTMHLSPGVPVMKSTDLVNWETVNYVYDRLDDGDEMNLRNGKSMYGKGQWASSIVYHNGTYYVGFNSNTTGTAYIFKTDDIEHGSWTRTKLNAYMHDMAIFFDGDTPYVVWGGKNIQYQELEADMSGLKKDGKSGTLFTDDTASTIVNAEGTHVMKKGDYYYVFNIVWPNGGVRQEICHRSKTFPGTAEDWEKKVILDANFKNNGTSAGVAQGGIIDTEDGKWYGYLFQDHGAVGRVPVLTDCVFKDGWPMLGKNGDGKTVELTMDMPLPSSGESSLTKSDEFYNDAEHRVFEEGYTGSEKTGSGSGTIENNKPTPTVGKSIVELFTNGDVSTGTTAGWGVMEQAELGVALEDGSPVEKSESENEAEESDKNYCLWVKNRQACAGGAMQDISGKIEVGKEYTFKGRLKYVDGPAEKTFRLEIQNGPNYKWRDNIVQFTAKKGEWTEFEGKYTVPASVNTAGEDCEFHDDQNYIFMETPWTGSPTKEKDLMDYYLDDCSMTGEGGTIVDNGDMEEGTQGWGKYQHKSGDGTIDVEVTEDAHSGEKALKTKNREHTNDGLGQVFKNVFIPGYTYEFTAWVKQDEVESKKIAMTVRKGEGENFSTIDTQEVKKGEWTKLTGTYKFSEDDDVSVDTLFFETEWKSNSDTKEEDLVDIYVDDVAIVEKSRATEAEKAAQGEDDYYGSNLDLAWQWNHNPDNTKWSLTDRNGWLRLTTGKRCESILNARNTLTQRTYGPTCSGTTKLDISHMKDGDVAGLAAFSYNYSYIAAKKEDGKTKLVMVDATQNDSKKEDSPKEIASVECEGNIVYFKDDYDFAGGDKVSFYYSFDGKEWTQLGETVKTSYELTHFMGSRFALFNYATKSKGGYVDFDYFRVSDAITGTENTQKDLSAGLSFSKSEISGVVNNEVEATVKLGKIEKASHNKIKASFEVPELMNVEDVEFNDAAINGEATYTFSKNRLVLEVTGDDVSFDAADGVFATIKLKLNGYVREDKTVDITADYIQLDGGKTEVDASGAKASLKLTYLDTGAIAKKLGFSNPLVTQEYGADPYAIVYNDRVYVYMTADAAQYDANGNLQENGYGYINTLRVISSSDMVNWTDHGEIKVAGKDGAAKWATNSWAPAIAHKKINGEDKFFVYFANNGSGIGVIEGDSPLGPWRDPVGKALLTQGTPGCRDVVWCFDPAVLVDDDGTGYIYFGGGVPSGKQNNPKTARVAKLGDDMISIVGEAKEIDAPCMFEDSGIFKYNGKYYYSYCSNFTGPHKEGYPGMGNIAYMVSDNPMGPFTYAGEIFDNPGVWFNTQGNNHHATFVFRDKSYFIYHAQTVAKEKNEQKGYRSTHIDTIEMTPKGNIKPVKGTYEGISQLETVNPYETIEAETIAWNKGIKVTNIDDFHMELSSIDNGDWTSVAGVDFGEKGADKFTARVKSAKGGRIEVRLDSPEGSLIGTVKVPAGTKKYTDITTDVTPVAGERNVFFVFKGEGSDIMTVDSYVFTEGEGGSETPDKPTPDTPDKPTPDTPAPENPSKGETKPEDTTKPVSEPAAKASAGNGKTSTADQIAAPGDTTTLASAESGKVTVNAGAKKLALKGDKGTFKVVKGKSVKVSRTGKLTFKKGAADCEVQFKVDGKEVTKSIHVETPAMEKKVAGKAGEAVELALTGTDIKTAVWSTNKTKAAKVSVSKDGKHVSVSYGKKGTIKVFAEINGKKYTTKVTFK